MTTETLTMSDLLDEIQRQETHGAFTRVAVEDPESEVGRMAQQYNRVVDRVHDEIKKHRRTAEQLRQAARQTRDVIDTANDAFFSADFSGSIREWSAKAEELFGWTADEIAGRKLNDTLIPGSADTRTGGLGDLVGARGSGNRLETTARHKNGRDLMIEVSIAPMRIGSSFVFNAFAHDIGHRRKMQAQLAQAQKLESVGQLAAGIAHEINTPTQFVGDNLRFLEEAFGDLQTTIDAFLALLNASRSEGPVPENFIQRAEQSIAEADLEYLVVEIPQAISQALEGIGRVATIVRSMKEFSHPGGDRMTLVHLNQAIETTMTVARTEWKYVADIETEFDEDLPPVNCLPGELNQVVLNLIVNAAHAIADAGGGKDGRKGTITIGTRSADAWIEFFVQDTGCGIPPAIRDKIFDPFFTTKEVGKGTGQGLAIAHNVVVEKHGGEIQCESEVGRGTKFTIRLPNAGAR